jgi:transcriptional regulator with PAS, ATPase and Fis domain
MSEVDALRRELEGRFQVGDFVSRSILMQKVFEVLPAISASPSTVLIYGETGTGKELMARTIHDLESAREQALHCGELRCLARYAARVGTFRLQSRGIYRGSQRQARAVSRWPGEAPCFWMKSPTSAQLFRLRLLRVLQERTYEPLGATQTETADVRIVVATNKDLSDGNPTRQFSRRSILPRQCGAGRIAAPAAAQGRHSHLVNQFIDRFNRLQQKAVEGIAGDALSMLMAHHWPGNVRELENIIERAFIMCGAEHIGIEHLPEELTAHSSGKGGGTSMKTAREMLDAQSIRAALDRNNYNRLAAAKDLGIHKSTLFRKSKNSALHFPARMVDPIARVGRNSATVRWV